MDGRVVAGGLMGIGAMIGVAGFLVLGSGPPPEAPSAAPAPPTPATAPAVRTYTPTPPPPEAEEPGPVVPTERPATDERDAAFEAVHTEVQAFLGTPYEPTIPEDADPEAENLAMKTSYAERAKEFGALERRLSVIAKTDGRHSIAAWTDIAAIRLSLAEDLLASPVPAQLDEAQAAAYAEALEVKAGKLVDAADEALGMARTGERSPEEQAAIDAIDQRIQSL